MSHTPDFLIVGLGNPGPEYTDTRHNVGMQVVALLAERLDASLQKVTEASARIGQARHKDVEIALAQPLTYMNRSGHAVKALIDRFALTPQALLVIVDDLHLDTGQLRLRPGGSSGGHNGVSDIARQIGTTDFPRLRIGIGKKYARGEQANYVLSPFSAQQQPLIEEARIRAGSAALCAATKGLDAAMNRYNG
ncbi:MAG: aminoacyl-tRNA hydrolase [Longimonas sp.]|uniref:aminoacyl-tRNA hydrolase n=1 Tax=Longimonas sp. TaxID=2039626 RepID=UPI003350EE40